MKSTLSIGVMGAGSWGTALAVLLAGNGNEVALWGHREEHRRNLQKDRENRKYLEGIQFPETLTIGETIEQTVSGKDIIIMAIPSHCFRLVFRETILYLKSRCRIISAVKGIENKSLLTMSKVMEDELHKGIGAGFDCEIGVISGPSFAKEVAEGVPTAVTIGFSNLTVARQMQGVFVNETFRVYASQDVVGLEISAALKNIIAIAAGVCDGLGYGLNTRAALITRGLAEIRRLGIALQAESSTFAGLSGLGDLVLTCTGDLSRNRNVGLMLGQGKTVSEVEKEMKMVAEGIKTTHSVYDLARKMRIEMPILEQVYKILYENKACSIAVKDLLTRELKVESDYD